MNIGTIILAAGSSTRMGKSKQLLSIDGESMLHRAVSVALLSKSSHVVVVLGSNEKDHRKSIKDLRASIVENRDWQKGMGNSLKAGLKHLTAVEPQISSVIIMVCDQPSVTSEHLNELIATYEKTRKPVVASWYSGSPGVPALIDSVLFPDLAAIEDSNGAKKIIQAHQKEAVMIEFKNGEIDLDTPEEYQNYINRK